MPQNAHYIDTILDYADVIIGTETYRVAIPLSDVLVTVLEQETTDPADTEIYEDIDGTVEKDNPFLTVNGLHEFFAPEEKVYEISFEDTIVPARIAPKTIYWTPGLLTRPANTFSLSQTYPIQGEVKQPSGDDYVLPPFPIPVLSGSQSVVLKQIKYRLLNGSAANRVTFAIYRNGIALPDYSGVNAIQTAINANWNPVDKPDVTLASNDELQIVVTATTGTPKNLSIAFDFEHTIG